MFQPGFGERRTAENVVILLTDGQSNINYYDTIPAATDLKSDGVTVIGIGIGLTNADELNAIASGPREVFQVATFDALNDIKAEIVSVSGLDTVCTGGCLYALRTVSQKKILHCILLLLFLEVHLLFSNCMSEFYNLSAGTFTQQKMEQTRVSK